MLSNISESSSLWVEGVMLIVSGSPWTLICYILSLFLYLFMLNPRKSTIFVYNHKNVKTHKNRVGMETFPGVLRQ